MYAAWHDGPAAWADIVARSAPATALAPETDDHEDHMTALRLKPLPDGASADDFGKRVNDALVNHIPFLRRPFPAADGSLGMWIILQMPEALAADGRRLSSTSTIAQLSNGSAIASACIAIVAAGQKPSVKDGPLGDFILLQDESENAQQGRRPRGQRCRPVHQGVHAADVPQAARVGAWMRLWLLGRLSSRCWYLHRGLHVIVS